MQYKKNNTQVGLMIGRCHRWRQKRKQYLDQARQTPDEIERERLLQMAEHYGRIVSDEQGKIDNNRTPGDKQARADSSQPCDIDAIPGESATDTNSEDEDDIGFPDFLTQL